MQYKANMQIVLSCNNVERVRRQKIKHEFISWNATIFVGLMGKTALFDRNLPKFEESIQTLRIGKPEDNRQAISRCHCNIVPVDLMSINELLLS